MIRDTVYEYLEKYFNKYLIGFDKSKLAVALMSGSIELRDVNLNPVSINRLFEKYKVPFALKAGSIGKFEFKVDFLSFIEDEDDDLPYNDNNSYNIFQHSLNINPKSTKVRKTKGKDTKETNEWIENYLITFLRNARISVRNIHIRFEDDYYCKTLPYAFGILCDHVTAYTVGKYWKFGSLEQEQFVSTPIQTSPNTFIKELTGLGFRVYFFSNADVIIPRQLWEETIDLEGYVFSKMSLAQYTASMNKVAANISPSNLILSKANIYTSSIFTHKPHYALKSDILITSAVVNVTPDFLSALLQLNEFIENYKLSFELKGYRPARRVITRPKRPDDTPEYLLKRKLLVRDWFFFIVWYVRLKKTLNALKAIQEETPVGYIGMFFKLVKDNCKVALRCQEISAQLWNDYEEDKRMVVKKTEVPNLKVFMKNPTIEYYNIEGKVGFSGLMKEFTVVANYRKKEEEEVNDSPISVARVPPISPAVFKNAVEAVKADRADLRAPITQTQGKALYPPKLDTALISLISTTTGNAEDAHPKTQRAAQRVVPEYSHTPTGNKHILLPAPEKSPFKKEEERKIQKVTELADEASGRKIKSVVLFQLGAGYCKEGVIRFSYLQEEARLSFNGKAADMFVMVNEELVESVCQTIFDYTSLYWLRDFIFCGNSCGFTKKLKVYAVYPRLAIKDAINWANSAVESYSVDVQTKSIQASYFDQAFSAALIEMSYPGISLGVAKRQDMHSVNLFGLKLTLSESILGAKTILTNLSTKIWDLLETTIWKNYADTMKAIKEMRLLKKTKSEHKPILKRNASGGKKKVTFMAQNELEAEAEDKKEHKRLKSPPKEKSEEPEVTKVEEVPRKPAESSKAHNENQPAAGVEVEQKVQKKTAQTKPLASVESNPKVPVSKVKSSASDTSLTEHVVKPNSQIKKPEPEIKKTVPQVVTEVNEELEMPKPKKKQVTTSAMYAKMKAIHKKRKEVYNIGGSAKDLNKLVSKPKK